MKSSAKKVELAPYDDLFSTEESRQDAKLEKIREIPLSELHPFKNHPFKVKDDEAMMETADSVRQYGVLVPAIARPDPEGGYELVAGHRRHRASELAEKETMPVIVRDLDDDAATIIMVDSNLQRESLLPSERAFAYFYILIDRANEDKETAVHFLNQVDEADLMALMEDSQTTQEQPATCTCTEKCVAGAVNTACTVCATNMSACTGKEPEPETPEETPEPEEPAQKPAGLNPAILLAVLALMGGGGALAYFKLVKNKPKTKGNDNLDDYDYGEDDTDQEDEDSWETEESDEPDADGGGDEESEDKTV